uniref:NB-ARC domain-containing protein n=1 Tax=Oryza meridionalis TaxID=40149 RepID=A0A0E0EA28_9ORYZ
MNTSVTREHWNHVLESNLWADNDEAKNNVLPALKVSYDHLPAPLKRCFAFCSLFPKSFVFNKDALVQLWTAQGFVKTRGECRPEDVGAGYFYDLVARCFFQLSPSHGIGKGKYVMHDLYQELAQFDDHQLNLTGADKTTRHLSIVHDESNSDEELLLKSFYSHDLRTFLFLARMEQVIRGEMPCRRKIVPCGLVTDFECLRALDLSNTDIVEVPKSIGSLIHLRYLGLDNTGIQMLPESVGALFHLQTIKLNHCSSLTQLPQGIKLLLNLRCLEIAHSNVQMPSGIRVLTSLQKLPIFKGYSNAVVLTKELGHLQSLMVVRFFLRALNLSGTTTVELTSSIIGRMKHLRFLALNNTKTESLPIPTDCSDSTKNLTKLRHLDVRKKPGNVHVRMASGLGQLTDLQTVTVFNIGDDLSHCSIGDLKNLCRLRGHIHITGLQNITAGDDAKEANLVDSSLGMLVSITIDDCQNCNEIPYLGDLPSLKYLFIQKMYVVESFGQRTTNDTAAQVLQYLRPNSNQEELIIEGYNGSSFPSWVGSLPLDRDMGAWEEWSEFKDEHFPQLKYLSIVRCAKLTVLPNFTSGPKQRIRSCEKLLQPLCQNIRRNLMKYIPPPSELSYACMAEVTFYSVFRTIFSQLKNVEATCYAKAFEPYKETVDMAVLGPYADLVRQLDDGSFSFEICADTHITSAETPKKVALTKRTARKHVSRRC